jgi:hypothetical protein
VIYADAGDFTGDPTIPGEKQTDALIEGMGRMGYLVSGFGPRELNHGWEKFAARQKGAKFPFVSGNLVWQDTGEPVVQPFVISKVTLRPGAKNKDARIAFLGLSAANPAFLKTGPGERRIVTSDPVAAAAKYVPQMRPKADLIVVLSSLDLEAARNLARKVKDIDLIIGGSGPIQTRTDDFPEDSQIGRAHLQYIGDQGKNLGEVRLTFGDKRALGTVVRNVIGLTRDWPDEPALAELMEQTKVAVNDYNRTQADATNPFAAPAGAAAAPATPPGSPAPATYTGSERCKTCHEPEYAVWAKSAHAHAFNILESVHQDFNPQCVGCHSIGYGRPRGFLNAKATPDLKHVGCESCHGPSSLHPNPVAKGFGPATTATCTDCHTRDNSPDYNPSIYIPQVKHWTEKTAAK